MSQVIADLSHPLEEELPLIDLFTNLREAGLPLGIGEYQLMVKALQGGFGTANEDELKRLCQQLWVKSPQEIRLFDFHFQQVISKKATPQKQSEVKSKVETSEVNPSLHYSQKNKSTTLKEQSSQQVQPKDTLTDSSSSTTDIAPTVPTPAPEYVISTEDEVQVAQAVKATNRDDDVCDRYFLLTSDYLPVTRRQMKQIWRYLRCFVREGVPTELDIDATVRQIGQLGSLLAPVLVPRRVNRTDLLLMLDLDGSMVPFHTLSHRLAETALRGGRLGSANIYYFHNCPVDHLYHDPAHLNAEAIDDLFPRLRSERTVALIFSDGGAARGGYSNERLKLTKLFLDRLRQRVNHLAWLNPVPQKRWQGTTAEEISKLLPMFELDRRGMDNAIQVLRGRSIGGNK